MKYIVSETKVRKGRKPRSCVAGHLLRVSPIVRRRPAYGGVGTSAWHSHSRRARVSPLTEMQTFYTQVATILGTLADVVQPRTFEELKSYGFVDLPVRS
jgi:hypothetical protein